MEARATQTTCRSQSSFHPVDPGDQTQAVKLAKQVPAEPFYQPTFKKEIDLTYCCLAFNSWPQVVL